MGCLRGWMCGQRYWVVEFERSFKTGGIADEEAGPEARGMFRTSCSKMFYAFIRHNENGIDRQRSDRNEARGEHCYSCILEIM